MHKTLNEVQQKLRKATQQFSLHAVQVSTSSFASKVNRPQSFTRKEFIPSWKAQVSNYHNTVGDSQALTIAISYLAGSVDEWWIVFKDTGVGRAVTTRSALNNDLVSRFDTLNNENIARENLAKLK